MDNLTHLREEIDKIDKELTRLYTKRMSIVRNVAAQKGHSDISIYNSERENQVLDKVQSFTKPELKCYITSLYRNLMRQSREYQYSLLIQNGYEDTILKSISKAQPNPPVNRCAYAGLPGSYSHIAAGSMYKGAQLINTESFDDVFHAVKEGRADIGMLPLENSTEGTVNEVYDLILKYNFFIARSFLLPVRHCLAAPIGAAIEDIKKVHSHPQALAQCADFIKKYGFSPVTHVNTAVAAKFVAERGRKDDAVISSQIAARQYNLNIIERDINSSEHNTTRFIAVSDKLYIGEDADKISLSFTLSHESGSLASALSIFSDYGLSLDKIQSRPIMDKPWEYRFYLDFIGNTNDVRVKALLFQLNSELPELTFLGSYKEQNNSEKV